MKTENLHKAYMLLGEVCHDLAALSREVGEKSAGAIAGDEAPIEGARQKTASARIAVWSSLKESVWTDWLNDTDTPDLLCRFPPKDMPGRQS